MTDETCSGWVKLYTPENALVTVPIPLTEAITPDIAGNMLTSVRNLIGAGFSVNERGLADGELSMEAAFVSKRSASDGTPILDFFAPHPKAEKKIIHVYLNTEADIEAFEKASGTTVASIPPYEGEVAIDKKSTKAVKYIVPLKNPVRLVYVITQSWKEWNEAGGTGQQPRKKDLVRYERIGNATAPEAPAPEADTPSDDGLQAAMMVKTPHGTRLEDLTDQQLHLLHTSAAANVTDEMRTAASTVLKARSRG